ncbi:MAG TPA: purine-binding chemotaxis protein CheW [Caldithrix abyssi]|uniref:Purine-binding chemotaxis protein CheW n=1 Tax=Caldithrix abyssi TaxID=187145 RepID=A0A7V5PPP5_CALAY|nr:purine-binding chemotaxis protein CheW [Caldithrix abyssi]
MNNPKPENSDAELRYSIFEISRQNFGVEVQQVVEVLPLPKYTPLPNVHDSILGVFSLRGQIHSIIDLRELFNLEKKPPQSSDYVVLLTHQDVVFGVLVNRIIEITNLDATKIALPTQEMAVQYIEYTSGYYESPSLGRVYLLDLEAVLNSPEINRYRYF